MIAGVVLCGGQSRRMGTSKAWLPFGTETMLVRVVRILGEVTPTIVVVAAADQDLPPLPPDVLIARDAAADLGPLQGLLAAWHALPKEVDTIYVCGCDVPRLVPDFVRRVISALGDADAVTVLHEGKLQPLASAYRRSVLPEIEQLLQADSLRVIDLLECVNTRKLLADALRDVDPELASLENLNTPEAYRQACVACSFA